MNQLFILCFHVKEGENLEVLFLGSDAMVLLIRTPLVCEAWYWAQIDKVNYIMHW